MRAFRLLPVLLALLLAALAVVPALAAPTDVKPGDNFVVIPISDTEQIPADFCGFPLVVTIDGWVKIRFPSNTQSGVIEVDSVHTHSTLTNPANGKSSDGIAAATFRYVDNGDGTVTLTITGLQGRDTIPGEGRVTGDIGRLVLVFDAATGDFISQTFIAGPHSGGPFPGVCAGLA